MKRAWIPVVLVLALGCGRYGDPIRPPPPAPAPPPQVEQDTPEAPELELEPDFRLDLPGLPGIDDDE